MKIIQTWRFTCSLAQLASSLQVAERFGRPAICGAADV
jgi:hypothetical protein